jgi:hypothetical protein
MNSLKFLFYTWFGLSQYLVDVIVFIKTFLISSHVARILFISPINCYVNLRKTHILNLLIKKKKSKGVKSGDHDG